MVKGVNKTVIEINDTGNSMFEKIILFVSPEFSNINTARLKSEAQQAIIKCSVGSLRLTARQKALKKRRLFVLGVSAAIIVGIAVAVILFNKV